MLQFIASGIFTQMHTLDVMQCMCCVLTHQALSKLLVCCGMQPEQRRGLYPAIPPLVRPQPPSAAVWLGPDHRDIRDVHNRHGQYYPQRDSSPTPSPRSWQATPHALDPPISGGGPHLHGPSQYGSPAHFDPMARAPREASHMSNQLRIQEEAEHRHSPRTTDRPLSRGPSMERAVWQQPLMRGSGPGLGPFVPGGQGPPRPAVGAGPPRFCQTPCSACMHPSNMSRDPPSCQPTVHTGNGM